MRLMARSKVRSEIARERLLRLASLSPAERLALAARLGEESVVLYMATQKVDRRTAITRIKQTRRLGRQRSASAEP